MSVPVTIQDDILRPFDGASDKGRIVAGTAGFTVKEKGSQVLSPSEMEKRADTADISVLFFSGCANFLAVYAQTN